MRATQDHSRRRSRAADKGRGQTDARCQPARLSARRGEPWRAHFFDRLRHYRRRYRRGRVAQNFRIQRRAPRRRCSAAPNLRRLIPKATSPSHSRSMPITTKTRLRLSMAKPTSWKSPGWLKTKGHGRSTNCTRSPRSRRSPGTFASKAGAQSAPGRAHHCRNS